jgi:hypothetical protein
MSTPRVFAVSLALALFINALVAVGAAVAAIDTLRTDVGPTELVVSGSSALTPADFAAVAQQLGRAASFGPIVSGMEPVTNTSGGIAALVQGVSATFPQVTAWQTDQGRFLTGQDDVSLEPVAVIDESLAQQLFPNGDAVGSTLRIDEIPFTIVGIGSDPRDKDVILVPFRTAQIRLFGRGALNAIVVRVSSGSDATGIGQATEALLRARHNLRPGQPDDFTMSTEPVTSADNAITGPRVLQVFQQFMCPAKNTCPRRAAF